MTCIVGMLDSHGGIYMGADSAAIGDWDQRRVREPKVFLTGEFLIGYTTSFRFGQLLRHALPDQKPFPDVDPMRFMCTSFVDQVRAALKAGGYAKRENEVEHGGNMLVGFRGGLYEIGDDYSVLRTDDAYAAIGIGFPFALGSLFNYRPKARDAVKAALFAAAYHAKGVLQPFHITHLEPTP